MQMIKKRKTRGSRWIKVSFVVSADDARLPASVVGSFNDWLEGVDVFRRRSNGTASAVVSLESGSSYRFRYRSDDGNWFNDDAADGYEANDHGSTDCVLEL
jgi:1,4-alpha-glucan branching enzyme